MHARARCRVRVHIEFSSFGGFVGGLFLVNLVWYDEVDFCPLFFGNSMYNDHNPFILKIHIFVIK